MFIELHDEHNESIHINVNHIEAMKRNKVKNITSVWTMDNETVWEVIEEPETIIELINLHKASELMNQVEMLRTGVLEAITDTNFYNLLADIKDRQ